MSQQTCPAGTYFSIARGRCVANNVSPSASSCPSGQVWVPGDFSGPGACVPAMNIPTSSGLDWGRVALVGLGLAAVVGVGYFVVRSM